MPLHRWFKHKQAGGTVQLVGSTVQLSQAGCTVQLAQAGGTVQRA